jgi:uncharacterized protein (TIGR03089 family)
VPANRDLPADVPTLLRELLIADSGRPRVTWYGPNSERVEFSAKTLNNWVSKTSNLLVDELDVGPGSRLGLALPVHWRTVVWLLAGWSVGATTVVLDDQPDAAFEAPLDVLVTDRPSAPPPGTETSLLVVVALPALATRYLGDDIPNGAIDAAAEVRLQPDAFTATAHPDGRTPAFVAGARTVHYDELLDVARADSKPGVRLFTGAGPGRALEAYLGPLATGGSVVLHHDPASLAPSDLDHLSHQEGVTGTLS